MGFSDVLDTFEVGVVYVSGNPKSMPSYSSFLRDQTPPDTTSDTTQSATRGNTGQPPAKKVAYLSRLCNIEQPLETGFGALWL